jgi:hypothetical protein
MMVHPGKFLSRTKLIIGIIKIYPITGRGYGYNAKKIQHFRKEASRPEQPN